LVRATKILDARKSSFKEGAEDWGRISVAEICKAPLKALIKNSGSEFKEDILTELKENSTLAYDVMDKKIVESYEAGILDPAQVVLEALFNAAAVNRSICNSSAFIVEDNV
jgi:chaperonin GroEL (HSP60 family)